MLARRHEAVDLGEMHAASFASDPKHLGFVLARYKFVAKMLTGAGKVLEVGCGDGTGARVVKAYVGQWFGIDKQEQLLLSKEFRRHDILEGPYGYWDAVYALDVMEHIAPENEDVFLGHITSMIDLAGVCIIGMPSLESQVYASPQSVAGHVNCKTEEGLRESLQKWFRNVFLFGMNDETLTTGFGPMCHYRLALCIGKR